MAGEDAGGKGAPAAGGARRTPSQPPMNEKIPIPCELCRGKGLIAGIECAEYGCW
jgi:hypothetical protein